MMFELPTWISKRKRRKPRDGRSCKRHGFLTIDMFTKRTRRRKNYNSSDSFLSTIYLCNLCTQESRDKLKQKAQK